MGFIAKLAGQKSVVSDAHATGRAMWRQTFGIAKEDAPQPQVRPVPGGTWDRGVMGGPTNGPAYRRLVQAMRSMAPGGWSDDRYSQSNHYLSVPYAAISSICRQLSSAVFAVYKKDEHNPKGKRPVHRDDPPEKGRLCRPHDLVKLLERPNNQDSFGQMMYRIGQQLRLTGTALNWMVPNRLGVPMELFVIPTCIAIPQPAINPDFPDGYWRIQPIYPYGPFSSYPTPTTSVGAPIAAQWMLRLMYPHPILRYDGFSPMTGMAQPIDELEMMDTSRWYSMKRGVNPSAVLELAGKESDMQPLPEPEIERIHAEWENSFQGPQNAGSLIVGTPGGELKPWGTSPKDMDYPNGWTQVADLIMGGGFGITKEACGMIATSNYATLYATLLQLYWMTLEPECGYIGGEFTKHLAPFFGDDLIVEVKCKPINDAEQKQGRLSLAAEKKAITYNELRDGLEMPRTKEKWGEERVGGEELKQQEEQMKQQQAQQQGGQDQALAGMGAMAMGAGQGKPQEAAKPVEKARPRPTDQGLGVGTAPPRTKLLKALAEGPKRTVKELIGAVQTKGFYEQMMEATANGDGH